MINNSSEERVLKRVDLEYKLCVLFNDVNDEQPALISAFLLFICTEATSIKRMGKQSCIIHLVWFLPFSAAWVMVRSQKNVENDNNNNKNTKRHLLECLTEVRLGTTEVQFVCETCRSEQRQQSKKKF